jgi:hypothetical protein
MIKEMSIASKMFMGHPFIIMNRHQVQSILALVAWQRGTESPVPCPADGDFPLFDVGTDLRAEVDCSAAR